MAKNTRALVEEIAKPIAQEMGYFYIDTEYAKQGTSYVLTIVIDKQGGVQFEDCERLSRMVEEVLDEKDFIAESYCLCVSSPGLDRVLKKPADFECGIGRDVQVHLYKPFNGKKEFVGKLVSYNDTSITIHTEEEEIVFELKETAKINLFVSF